MCGTPMKRPPRTRSKSTLDTCAASWAGTCWRPSAAPATAWSPARPEAAYEALVAAALAAGPADDYRRGRAERGVPGWWRGPGRRARLRTAALRRRHGLRDRESGRRTRIRLRAYATD